MAWLIKKRRSVGVFRKVLKGLVGGERELVAWAIEDEDGGIAQVFAREEVRGCGAARWALTVLLEQLHSDFAIKLRPVPPFMV